MKRRIEIVSFERERIVVQPAALSCVICQTAGEWLTARQAGALAQVRTQTIYRWLATHRAHGLRTAGGQHRVCRQSLFVQPNQIAKPTKLAKENL